MRRLGLMVVTLVGTMLVAGTFVLAPMASATEHAASGTMSAKDFRKVANNLCRQGTQLRTQLLLQHFPDGGKTTPTASQIASFVDDYKNVVQQQIDSLKALKPPANLRPKMAKLLASAKKALAKVVAKPTTLLSGTDPFESVNQQSLALGLTDCAG